MIIGWCLVIDADDQGQTSGEPARLQLLDPPGLLALTFNRSWLRSSFGFRAGRASGTAAGRPPVTGRQLTSAPPWGFNSVPAAFCPGSGHCRCHLGSWTLRPPSPPGAIVRQGATPRLLIAAAASCPRLPGAEDRSAGPLPAGRAPCREIFPELPRDHPGSCYLCRVNIPELGISPAFACSSLGHVKSP